MELFSSAFVLADAVPRDGVTDASDAIQALIDANPNRTLFFPDGVYRLTKPVCTPADPAKSVSLRLGDFAVFRADAHWDSPEAMVRLGGKDPANDIRSCGSCYGITGGVLDGSGVAKGLSIDSGRETAVRQLSMKNVTVGLHIKYGANSGSSDADVREVNIVGTGTPGSVGVLVEGYDNTFSNMRIANVFTGFDIRSNGNALRSIHPLYTSPYDRYRDSCAFVVRGVGNWLHTCYSDEFATGFCLTGDGPNHFADCFAMWYSSRGDHHTAFAADGRFCATVSTPLVSFRPDVPATFLRVGEKGGSGVVIDPNFNPVPLTDDALQDYLQGKIVTM